MSRRVTPARGFTLLETLIAVSILGFIGLLTFGVFARSMDARDRATVMTEHYHQVRQAMLRMSREIAQAYLTYHRDCDDPRTQSLFIGRRAGNGARLDFTSFTHYKVRADANESDQEELSYFVDRDPNDSKHTALIRRSQPRIDEEAKDGGVEQVLAERVKSVDFEFYDANADRWRDEWDTTDSEFRDRLPQFVRMKLTVLSPSGKEESFVTKTRVFLRAPISIAGTGFSRCVD